MRHALSSNRVGRFPLRSALVMTLGTLLTGPIQAEDPRVYSGLREVNPPANPEPGPPVAILGALLFDGIGGPPLADSAVVVRGTTIEAAGPRAEVEIPDDAQIMDASGLSLLPGLIDSHFHHNRNDPTNRLPATFLSRGITSLRDPGHPIPAYQHVIESKAPLPRCFLTGRHFDQEPHAYPDDAEAIESPDEARAAVDRRLAEGASAIKVYFRLPVDLIQATCEAAHHRGVPVTAHLELVDADLAIAAGLDGVEHITSFGTALANPDEAEQFRASVQADNAARQHGRFRLWASIDLDDNPKLPPLLDLIQSRGVVLSPTLAVFERREGDRDTEDFHLQGFATMKRFVRLCHEAGLPIVVGSHSSAPHGGTGGAYLREMELLVECGLTPAEAIVSATSLNARFLGCADRLGAILPGHTADLLLVRGHPIDSLEPLRHVDRVMLNGRWVSESDPDTDTPSGPGDHD